MSSATPTITQSFTSVASAIPSCIAAATNGPNDCHDVWRYNPSIPAAIAFSFLFGITTLVHIVQATRYRMKFCWVIIMAGIWETTAFVLRIVSAHHQQSIGIFLPEELLILLAPIWVNAFDFMLLGRMIYYFLPEKKVLGVRAIRFALYFVTMDVSTFVIQAIGGTILSRGSAESPSRLQLGLHIYMAGIALQETFILCFLVMTIMFHRRMLQLEHNGTLEQKGKQKWRALLYTLYASLTLITTRIIFRLVQYASGFNSPIPTHEIYFYAFEAFPMTCALYIMNITHPGGTLVGPDSDFPVKAEQEREEIRAKKAQKLEQARGGTTSVV